MNSPDFYKDPTYGFPEIATCMESTTDRMAKFYIRAIMPFIEHDEPFDKKDNKYQKKNILSRNKDKLDISECTTSNYIEIHLPDNITSVEKGDEFIVGFINADIDKPFIIGRYYK